MIVTRAEKIRMSLFEYYWGGHWGMRLLRILGGPLMLGIGGFLVFVGDKFSMAYGGFMVGYGLYYMFKPLFLIVTRLDYYKTSPLAIEIKGNKIRFMSEEGYSELNFSAFSKIIHRKTYFAFRMKKLTAICIPHKVLKEKQYHKLYELSQR